MKSKIAVILLAVFLCLTTGCNNASHIAQTPAPISSSGSNIVPSESETAQAEKKTEVDRPQSTESQTDSRAAENPASVSESDTQPTEAPDQAAHSAAVLPQPRTPAKKTDESERRPETAAPTEKEQPTPPATEESKPADQAVPAPGACLQGHGRHHLLPGRIVFHERRSGRLGKGCGADTLGDRGKQQAHLCADPLCGQPTIQNRSN